MADVSTVGMSGPLEPFAAGFVADLSRQGFQPVTVHKQVGLLAGLSGWLAAEDMPASGLSSEVAERFCAARRAAGHRSWVTVKALGPLLGYLRRLGIAPPASTLVPAGPVEELLLDSSMDCDEAAVDQDLVRGLVGAGIEGSSQRVRCYGGTPRRPRARLPRSFRSRPTGSIGVVRLPLSPRAALRPMPGRADRPSTARLGELRVALTRRAITS